MFAAVEVQVVRDLGDWIIDIVVAVGTLGAVVAAIGAALASRADAREARAELAADRRSREGAAERELARVLAAKQAQLIHILVNWDLNESASTVEGGLFNYSDTPVNSPTVRWLGEPGTGRLEQTYKHPLSPSAYSGEVMTFDLGEHPVAGLNPFSTRSICLDFEDAQGTAWRVYPDNALRMRHAPDIDVL